jgi:hypothetical protein
MLGKKIKRKESTKIINMADKDYNKISKLQDALKN